MDNFRQKLNVSNPYEFYFLKGIKQNNFLH